jgi:anti-sigma-K factor RskA
LTCDELREDLEAYSLGTLDARRARQVAQHVAECIDCSSVVRAYEMAVESLALSVPLYRASPRLKERVLGGIGALSVPAIAMPRRRLWAGAAAAVLLAFAIGGLAWAIVLSSEVSRLKEDNSRLAELTQLDAQQRAALLQLQGDLTSARNEQRRMSTTLEEQATLLIVALDPDLLPTELAGTSLAPGSSCNYVWSTKQSVGALTCKGLPATAFSNSYELWAIKGDRTVPVGSFVPGFDGTASLLVKFPESIPGPVSNLWITLEAMTANRSAPSGEVVLQPVPPQQAAR